MNNINDLSELKPAEYNPRKISNNAAKGLAKSLGEFGDISGIVWNKRTGNLIAGHQRVTELKKQGASIVDGNIVANGHEYKIRVVDWPIEKEKAANISANNPHIVGEFVSDMLGDVLNDINLEMLEGLELNKLIDEYKLDMGENFEPGSIDDQSTLDRPHTYKCPECGHEFTT